MNSPKQEVYWYTKKKPEIKKLQTNLAADVVVVGGGMAGLSAAQKLSEAGKKVIILECNFCGGGASGKSSGFLTPDSELQLADLLEKYGLDGAKKMRDFVNGGLNLIQDNIKKNNLECDYRIQDSLFVANSEKAFEKVRDEHEARIKFGYQSEIYSKEKLSNILGGQKYFGGVRYGGSFGLNSYLYCQEMKKILESRGVEIYEDTRVTEIKSREVVADSLTVKAKNIIVATDHFMPKSVSERQTVYHAQTFLAISAPLSKEVLQKIFPNDETMVWDTDLIYQYFRLVEGNRLLIGASSVVCTYEARESKKSKFILNKMHKYLDKKFGLSEIQFEYFWPGLIGVAKDLVPILGEDPEMKGVYFTSAATGLPWAAALGQYLAEKILHGRNDYDSYFSPIRHYPISNRLQTLLSKPFSFAISHGIIKYFK